MTAGTIQTKAIVVADDATARQEIVRALAETMACADFADAASAVGHLKAQPAGNATVVVVHAHDPDTGHGVMAVLKLADDVPPFLSLLVIASTAGGQSPPKDLAPDDLLRGSVSPGEIAARAALLARLSNAEAQLTRMRSFMPVPLYEAIRRGTAPPTPSRRELSILFGDIRGFTDATDFCEPDEMVALLNDYLEAAADVVGRHGGTVDKFTGDGFVAWFGEGSPSDAALAAVEAALDFQGHLEGLRKTWFERGVLPVGVGVGVTTGPVTLGTIGCGERADFTVVGSAVNLSARLQGLARGGEIVICGETHRRVRHAIAVRDARRVPVKGFDDPVDVYTVVGPLQAGARRRPWKD